MNELLQRIADSLKVSTPTEIEQGLKILERAVERVSEVRVRQID
jgi:hypothetical protein